MNFIHLFLSIGFAQLANFCPNSADRFTWSRVNTNEWYWGDDYPAYLANARDIFNNTEQYPPNDGIHPAGFRLYTLKQYSEPPICMTISQSRNKKVEVMMEADLGNANLCITDASYSGVATNDVGNIKNCGTGKVYACFTAATAASNANFQFYVSCESGCEDSDVGVWIRVRISELDWTVGKTNTTNDLEHWCEAERGTYFDENTEEHLYYTYPSDLVPDEPNSRPFWIQHTTPGNAGGMDRPRVWLVSLVAVLGLAYLLA